MMHIWTVYNVYNILYMWAFKTNIVVIIYSKPMQGQVECLFYVSWENFESCWETALFWSMVIFMALHKTMLAPSLMHWRYHSHVLNHWCVL